MVTLLLISSFILSSFAQENENLTSDSNDPISNIIILNFSNIIVESSVTDLTSITGTIQNNSTENVANLRVNVTLYDANNNTIMDASRFVSSPFTVYEPNSTQSFSFLMSVEDFYNYVATAYAERIP